MRVVGASNSIHDITAAAAANASSRGGQPDSQPDSSGASCLNQRRERERREGRKKKKNIGKWTGKRKHKKESLNSLLKKRPEKVVRELF